MVAISNKFAFFKTRVSEIKVKKVISKRMEVLTPPKESVLLIILFYSNLNLLTYKFDRRQLSI